MNRAKSIGIGGVIAIACCAALTAGADPTIRLGSQQVVAGTTALIPLTLTMAGGEFGGINAKFTLPPGVSLSSTISGELLGPGFIVNAAETDGIVSLLAYSQPDVNDPTQVSPVFGAIDGTLLTLELFIANDAQAQMGGDVGFLSFLEGTSIMSDPSALSSAAPLAIDGLISLTDAGLLAPILFVTPSQPSIATQGGQLLFNVFNLNSAVSGMTWQAVSGAEWITVQPDGSGVDNGIFTVIVDSNAGAAGRQAIITVQAPNAILPEALIVVRQEGDQEPQLSVSPLFAEIAPAGDTLIVEIQNIRNGTMEWSAQVVEGFEWVEITSASFGSSTGEADPLTLQILPNNASGDRIATVAISAPGAINPFQVVEILQLSPSVLSVLPEIAHVPAGTGQTAFVVSNTGTGDFDWSAQVIVGAEWLTLEGDTSGRNMGTIAAEFAENVSPDGRSGIIRVTAPSVLGSPIDVTVVQAGDTSAVLSVLPGNHDVQPEAGSVAFTVTNLGNGELDWTATVTEGSEWVSIVDGSSGVNEGSIDVQFLENPLPEDRVATIRVEFEDSLIEFVDVTVTQLRRGAVLAVSPADHEVQPEAGNVAFSVTNQGNAALNWTASVTEGSDWVSIVDGSSGMDEGSIFVQFMDNPLPQERIATIRVEDPASLNEFVDVTVTQLRRGAILAVSPGDHQVQPEAGDVAFSVTNQGNAQLNWTATVMEGSEWASIVDGTSGVDEGSIRVQFLNNPLAEGRTATIHVEDMASLNEIVEVRITQLRRDVITVLMPNGGENWLRDGVFPITWTSPFLEERAKDATAVKILLLDGGNVVRVIAETTENDGIYFWKVPDDIERSPDYQIQIIDVGDPSNADVSDQLFAVECPPRPPQDVIVFDGNRNNRADIVWDSVPEADEYQVYRMLLPGDLEPVAVSKWQSKTSFVDEISASLFECNGDQVFASLQYFVKSRNECGTSVFSTFSTMAYGGLLDKSTRASVFPSQVLEEGVLSAQTDSQVAVLLSSAEEIDLESVWAVLSTNIDRKLVIDYIAISPTSVWVVTYPDDVWPHESVFTMTVSGNTVSGTPLPPVFQTFAVETAVHETMRLENPGDPVAQPDTELLDLGEIELSNDEVDLRTVPFALDESLDADIAIGTPFSAGPAGVYSKPQRVWIPLPQDQNPEDAYVYYYDDSGRDTGWFEGRGVNEWIAEDSDVILEVDGQTYIGVLINHSAILQIGLLPGQAKSVRIATGVPDAGGDLFIIVIAMLALVLLSRTSRNRARKS